MPTVFSSALGMINDENTKTLGLGGTKLDQLIVLSMAFAQQIRRPPDVKRLLSNANTLLKDACMFISNNAPYKDSPADPQLRPQGTCSALGCSVKLTGAELYCATCGRRSNHTDTAKQTHYLTVFCGCGGQKNSEDRTWHCTCIELQKTESIDTTNSELLQNTLCATNASLRHACDLPIVFCKTPPMQHSGCSRVVDKLCQEDEFAQGIRTLSNGIAHSGILYRALTKLLPSQRRLLGAFVEHSSAER